MGKEKDPLENWDLFNQQPEDSIKQVSPVEKKQYLTVNEFLDLVNDNLAKIDCRVLGEMSDINARDRYCFFVLKESDPDAESAVVECFIGWRSYETYKHLLQDGMQVVITGFAGIYKKSGRFRIDVLKIEPFGEGALKQAFEALKKKLQEKGYFAPEHKKALPEIIQKIGLVTSGAGAAIKDFLKNLGQYGFQIYHINVYVEGDYAEDSIISAIRYFNRNMPYLDVIVLIRGGGSIESLKAFNSESVADAIFDSWLPVITGIGHERDITIADFVADKSFSTPTAVASFIRTQREQLIQNLDLMVDGFISSMEANFEALQETIQSFQQDILSCFESILERYFFSIRHCAERMHGRLNLVFDSYRMIEKKFLSNLSEWHLHTRQMQGSFFEMRQALLHNFQSLLEKLNNRLKVAEARLTSSNPESILSRGYSIVYDDENKIIKDAGKTKQGDRIHIKLHKGKIISTVEQTNNNEGSGTC
ncbi:MAG TPA: exodeoxyribonuclease VII large subunit [bacterium]|nr:exodeoxyribonuclease VII large subunit [bacterium]